MKDKPLKSLLEQLPSITLGKPVGKIVSKVFVPRVTLVPPITFQEDIQFFGQLPKAKGVSQSIFTTSLEPILTPINIPYQIPQLIPKQIPKQIPRQIPRIIPEIIPKLYGDYLPFIFPSIKLKSPTFITKKKRKIVQFRFYYTPTLWGTALPKAKRLPTQKIFSGLELRPGVVMR